MTQNQITLAQARGGNATSKEEKDSTAPVVPGFGSSLAFVALQRMAQMFNQSTLVPKQFQGPSNIGNCIIAFEMAIRMGASPLMVMQNLYLVQGRPAWSSQFLIACFNQSGRYSSISYETEGAEGTDERRCRAYATELRTGERICGTWISIAMAKDEGWSTKSGSKWKTMPEQMLRYRAAAWFIRSVAPEIAMGLRTVEEEREIVTLAADQNGVYVPKERAAAPSISLAALRVGSDAPAEMVRPAEEDHPVVVSDLEAATTKDASPDDPDRNDVHPTEMLEMYDTVFDEPQPACAAMADIPNHPSLFSAGIPTPAARNSR